MRQLADGLWHWTARHPEWHPGEFGAQVGCYLAHEGGRTIMIDPLLDRGPRRLHRRRGRRRGHDPLPRARQRRGRGALGRRRQRAPRRRAAAAGRHAVRPDAGLRWHPLKRGKERPLELPGSRARSAFGDRIVGVDGGLRYWINNPVTDKRRTCSGASPSPQLAHLLEIDFERALVTHGEPVMNDARAALEDALAGEPWYHRPS